MAEFQDEDMPATRPELYGQACRLRVERRAPFIIKYANDNFLHTLGFKNQVEVLGRAFRICQGPKTAKNDVAMLIRNCVGAGIESVTLYAKNGEEKRISIRAFSVESLDGTKECALEMYDLDAPESDTKPGNEYPQAVLSAAKPHELIQVNVAFLDYYGCSLSDLHNNGLGIIFCEKTDRRSWKQLVRAGKTGRSTALQLTTVSASLHCELPMAVQVSPIFSKTEFAKVKRVNSISLTFFEEASLTHGVRRVDGHLPEFCLGHSDEELLDDDDFSSSDSDSSESDSELAVPRVAPARVTTELVTAQVTTELVTPQGTTGGEKYDPRGQCAQIDALNLIRSFECGMDFDTPCELPGSIEV